MERFYFEEPSIDRKAEAISYIKEFYDYNSNINGVGSLDKYLDNYEGWLKKLEEDYLRIPNKEIAPSKTYFLIREIDNKIIGMTNIRLALSDNFKRDGGHIGYSIRPTERGKGYNKINLYLGLKVCQEYGIDNVLMFAAKDNLASWKTMQSLGGIKTLEFLDDEFNHKFKYEINVNESINKYASIYESMIEQGISRKLSI